MQKTTGFSHMEKLWRKSTISMRITWEKLVPLQTLGILTNAKHCLISQEGFRIRIWCNENTIYIICVLNQDSWWIKHLRFKHCATRMRPPKDLLTKRPRFNVVGATRELHIGITAEDPAGEHAALEVQVRNRWPLM